MQLHHKVDAVVIGAGMSGLAAGIRLAMFDKKVVILEKHRITGGLNSYYQRGKRKYDVGLHALTNFAHKAERGRPLTKLLKQLRIPYDQLELSPQTYSLIDFPETQLKFDNDFDLLRQEIADKFPSQIDSFQRLDQMIMSFNETDLSQKSLQAKAVVRDYISDDQLVEMLFCPALIYGSAWENDMDFAQFVVMYKALFKEGFSRPKGGVRTILEILETKFKQAGGEIFFGQAVTRVHAHHGKVERVETSKGMSFETPLVFSSIGLPETNELSEITQKAEPGRLSFTESLLVTPDEISQDYSEATIVFANHQAKYSYQRPSTLFDDQSAVICFPDNYNGSTLGGEGMARVTFIANYELWNSLSRSQYLAEKEKVLNASIAMVNRHSKRPLPELSGHDVFTPKTIERYTWHRQGTVYGSETKLRDGRTSMEGLYICGTDQGFLGIVGACLSGISMANLHGLQGRP